MKIFRGIKHFQPFANPVVSIGTFDGVHVGHKTIIDRLNEEANRLNGQSLLITLWPHPRLVVESNKSHLRLLNTLEEKCQLLEKMGLQNLLILEFDYDFSRTSSDDFVRKILVEALNAQKIIIGYDHHFGRNREGSLEVLRQYVPIFGFEVEETPAQQIDEINVSSTKIRQALQGGDIQKAREYLGYEYYLSGVVEHGYNRGTKIGFPTANVRVDHPNKLIPADGVYAVKAKVNEKWYGGMMNIGERPTFEESERSLEVHLFDFDSDIYDTGITIEFWSWVRSEEKFDGVDSLKNQLSKDEAKARSLLLG